MGVTLEVLKTKQDKCIICLIKICQKPVTYFEGQETPHHTTRWMSAENWAAYDKKVKELLLSNEFNNLENCLSYKLGHGVCLQFKNSTAPKLSLCEILQEKLRPENIINVIECKIDWESEFCNDSSTLSNIKNKINSIDYSLESNIPVSQSNDNLVVISDQSSAIEYNCKTPAEHNTPPSSSDISDTAIKLSKKSPQKQSKQKLIISSDSTDSLLEYELHKNKISKVTNDNDSDQSISSDTQTVPVEKRKRKLYNGDDVVREYYDKCKLVKKSTRTLKSSSNACSEKQNKPISVDSSDSLECNHLQQNKSQTKNENDALTPKKHNSATFSKKSSPLKDVNENESDHLVSPYMPVEKRKKSYNDNDETNSETHDHDLKQDKNRIRTSKKLFELDRKHEKQVVTECKTPKHSALRSSKSESSTAKKKKRSHHEHEQDTCDQEKHSMKNWLGKKDSHNDKISSKLSKDKTKHAHTSKYKNVLATTDSNSIELKKKIEDDIQQTDVTDFNTKSDRKFIENLKELIYKKPEKVKMLDLVKIPVEKILASLNEHRLEFDNIFQTYKYQTKVRGLNSVDHFLVIDLVSNKIQQKMMEKLSELYEENKDGTPKYGELFSMVLMPEWIIRIFMSHFKMSRTEAISHIKAQNAYKEYCITDDQLDKMIKKK